MLRALYWVALLGLLQLSPAGQAQHLPREIEEGPDGSIVINLGGVPDPRTPVHTPEFAILRAKSRGIATHKLDEGSGGLDAAEKDYDYEGFTKPAQTTMRRTRKPKKAKSKRPLLLEWLGVAEWLVGKPLPTEGVEKKPSGHSSRAFGANQLFDEQENGRALSTTTANAPVDVDVPSHAHHNAANSHHHNAIARQGPQLQRISTKRREINQGCKSWSSFRTILSSRRQNLVDGNVQRPIESTPPLGSFSDAQSSTAVFGPRNGTSTTLPLPECFLNQLGLVCCNRVMEELIYRANDVMINANVNKCNVEIFSQLLRDLLEKQFQTTFEIVVANGDFAAKIHFKDNLMCKTIVTDKHVLAYGTPEPYQLVGYNVEEPLSA